MDAYAVVFRYRAGQPDPRAEGRPSGDGGRLHPPVDVHAGPPSRRFTPSNSGDPDESRSADRTHGQRPTPGTTPHTDLAT
jgi:hypothetical protein